MNPDQIALINSYGLCIYNIRSKYPLHIPIDINQIHNKSVVFKTHVGVVIVKDGHRYATEIYPNGDIIIHRAKDPKLIISIIKELIITNNILYNEEININNISIESMRCEGRSHVIIDTNLIVYDPNVVSVKYDRICYKDNSNAYVYNNSVIINSPSYDQTIYICKHIYTSIIHVLVILQNNTNSYFHLFPNDIIVYILQFYHSIHTNELY